MAFPWNLALYALAGFAGGLAALRTGVPAAPLAGSLLAAGLVSMSGRLEVAAWPGGTRTLLAPFRRGSATGFCTTAVVAQLARRGHVVPAHIHNGYALQLVSAVGHLRRHRLVFLSPPLRAMPTRGRSGASLQQRCS